MNFFNSICFKTKYKSFTTSCPPVIGHQISIEGQLGSAEMVSAAVQHADIILQMKTF